MTGDGGRKGLAMHVVAKYAREGNGMDGMRRGEAREANNGKRVREYHTITQRRTNKAVRSGAGACHDRTEVLTTNNCRQQFGGSGNQGE